MRSRRGALNKVGRTRVVAVSVEGWRRRRRVRTRLCTKTRTSITRMTTERCGGQLDAHAYSVVALFVVLWARFAMMMEVLGLHFLNVLLPFDILLVQPRPYESALRKYTGAQNTRFSTRLVQNIIKETLKSNTKWMDYDPKTASIISKELSELIKEKVKALNYSRYKIIVQVTLGQKRGQCTRVASRCLWDVNTDNFASDYAETRDCFCSVQVYGLYIQ